jgi:putative flavoprotein involved in K+ transport
VVWAGGEFQYPRIPDFAGADICIHNSTVVSWEDIAGNDPLIIGGNESGIDSAVHLSRRCNSVRVIDPNSAWDSAEHDPSRALSPFTQDRLRVMQKDHRIELLRDEIVSVEREGDEFLCTGESGQRFLTDSGYRVRNQPAGGERSVFLRSTRSGRAERT